MEQINLIVCVDENWGIGNENKLLTHLPEDLKRFKRLTQGNIVVMGRKTLESLPGGEPLKDRENIVMTRDKNYSREGVIVKNSVEEVLSYIETNNKKCKEVFIIGGGEIYKEFNRYCKNAYITKIHDKFTCDTHICNYDTLSDWEKIEEGKNKHHKKTSYNYIVYGRA